MKTQIIESEFASVSGAPLDGTHTLNESIFLPFSGRIEEQNDDVSSVREPVVLGVKGRTLDLLNDQRAEIERIVKKKAKA